MFAIKRKSTGKIIKIKHSFKDVCIYNPEEGSEMYVTFSEEHGFPFIIEDKSIIEEIIEKCEGRHFYPLESQNILNLRKSASISKQKMILK